MILSRHRLKRCDAESLKVVHGGDIGHSNPSNAHNSPSRWENCQLKSQFANADEAAARKEEGDWNFGPIESAMSASGATLTTRNDGSIFFDGVAPAEDVYSLTLRLKPRRHTVLRIEALPTKFTDGKVGVGRNPRDPNFGLSELEVELLSGQDHRLLKLTGSRADYSQNGWPVTAAFDGDTKTGWAVSPRQRE